MSEDFLRVLIILLGVAVVAIILIQQPKEGGMGAFSGGGGGSGASGTVFGSKGSGSFFFKLTGFVSLLFAIAIIALVSISNNSSSVLTSVPVAVEDTMVPGAKPAPTNNAEEIPGAIKSDTIPGTEQ